MNMNMNMSRWFLMVISYGFYSITLLFDTLVIYSCINYILLRKDFHPKRFIFYQPNAVKKLKIFCQCFLTAVNFFKKAPPQTLNKVLNMSLLKTRKDTQNHCKCFWRLTLKTSQCFRITFSSMKKHCMKSVQIRSFFWSINSCIRAKYGDLRSKSPYSLWIQENMDQKKLRIWTIFTQ